MNEKLRILTIFIMSLLPSLLMWANSSIEVTEINEDKLALDVEITDTSNLDSYEIQGSSDLSSWSTLKTETELDQNPSSHELDISSEAQYLRLKLNESSTNNDTFIEPEFVTVTGGTSTMGKMGGDELGDSSHPRHGIIISSFQMGKYEISNQSVIEVYNWALGEGYIYIDNTSGGSIRVRENASSNRALLGIRSFGQIRIQENNGTLEIIDNAENEACISISWLGAIYFCNWASEMMNYSPCYNIDTYECDFSENGYRLPTEAEWEFVASSENIDDRFTFGANINHSLANYNSNPGYSFDNNEESGYHPDYQSNGQPFIAPINSFSPNRYGIHNLMGNVTEWCYDSDYDYPFDYITETNPAYNDSEESNRIVRGGSWSASPIYCEVTARSYKDYELLSKSIGFRIAKKAE